VCYWERLTKCHEKYLVTWLHWGLKLLVGLEPTQPPAGYGAPGARLGLNDQSIVLTQHPPSSLSKQFYK